MEVACAASRAQGRHPQFAAMSPARTRGVNNDGRGWALLAGWLALKTGPRHRELIGLQWGDVDLQRGKLQVRRSIWQGVTGLPKGGLGRTVDLPGSGVDTLKGSTGTCAAPPCSASRTASHSPRA